MSDSVKKYKENLNERHLDVEEAKEGRELDLIAKAVKSGKIAKITERTAEIQSELRGASLLAALELACDEEGIS